MLDVLRGYVQVAGGLTEVTLKRAREMAETLMSHSEEAAERGSEQFSALAEDLVRQSQTNREILLGLIRTEIDRTVGRMGFVREEELAAVRNHVRRLEAQLKAMQSGAASAGSAAARSARSTVGRPSEPAAKPAAKRTAAKKAAPTKTVDDD